MVGRLQAHQLWSWIVGASMCEGVSSPSSSRTTLMWWCGDVEWEPGQADRQSACPCSVLGPKSKTQLAVSAPHLFLLLFAGILVGRPPPSPLPPHPDRCSSSCRRSQPARAWAGRPRDPVLLLFCTVGLMDWGCSFLVIAGESLVCYSSLGHR